MLLCSRLALSTDSRKRTAKSAKVPILALDVLRRRSKGSFLFTPELKYTRENEDKPFIECDLNFVCDGRIGIGEAKRTNKLGKKKAEELAQLAKYADLARSLNANQVIFATESDDWSESTKSSIDEVFSPLHFDVELLNGKDLRLQEK